ncbi:hypothetical protein ACET3Z_017802 [Daucus carota]
MHAFANSKHCDDRFKTLKEGDIYIIKNLKVKDYVGDETYRPVRTGKHVYFTSYTEFNKAETQGMQIEKYVFDLFHMTAVEKLAADNRFLIDMVGKVENVEELIKSNKNNEEKSRFKFDISDGSNVVKVTLFELFGEHIQNELSKHDKNDTFIIIACAKVGRYEGVPYLSNYQSTRIYINPDHYSVKELRKRLLTFTFNIILLNFHQLNNRIFFSWVNKSRVQVPEKKIEATPEPTPPPTIKILTVKEIRNIKSELKQDSAYCQVIAKRFTDQKSWYFRKCTGCNLELENEGGKFVCSQKNGCGRTIPYPDKRFRLCIFCSDQTGALPIVFPDCEIQRIIDKTVIDLQADCADEKDEDKFPQILNTMLKQKYTINLLITDENITKGSTVYDAKEIIQEVEKVETHDPLKVPDAEMKAAEMDEISVLHDTSPEGRATETPNTGKSTNMKTRARKEMDPLEFNAESLMEIKPVKNIKLEKP